MKTTFPLPVISGRHHHGPQTPTGMLRHEHELILRALALLEQIGRSLSAGKPVDRAALDWLIDFFKTFADRCHHGKEEQHLFPAMERHGIPREGGPTGVMLQEHELGRAFIRDIASGDDRAIAEAIHGYVALLRAHIDKENDILFEMAEEVIPQEEQRTLAQAFEAVEQLVAGPGLHERLLEGLAQLEGGEGESGNVLDVRSMIPRDRHPKIFQQYEQLKPGEHFILVNDHDPKPLYYQFAAERPGAFTWQYLEQGPEVWRVEIGKPA
jgi:hemerythrin-like domain-containing protein/uncharacterized protein (DUF2249 family)